MWLLLARAPVPDAPYWPGRRWLAVVDAGGWPLVWVFLVMNATVPLGVVGPLVTGIALCAGVTRTYRAIRVNHRYRFTTWRWGRILLTLLALGLTLKLSAFSV
jgi:hypothetical protein